MFFKCLGRFTIESLFLFLVGDVCMYATLNFHGVGKGMTWKWSVMKCFLVQKVPLF